jgi:hypothetical protein
MKYDNSSIPTGSDLRVLLNSEHISYGEIHGSLKSKGIFVGNNDKAITVPILSATILTPTEFSNLIEASVDRDSKPKVKVSALDLVSATSDWITPLKSDLFKPEFNPCANVDSVDFVDVPGIVVDSKDKVRIPYVLNRKDFSKDWTKRELNFSGEITIERQGANLKLDFASTHSSRETEIINRRLISRISKILKDAGATQSENERRITFGCFTNVERVRFFKRLTGGFGKILGKGSVNDMEISRDIFGPPLPNDPQVAWMNQSVKRLKIDGEKLNDIFLISDEKYYSFYHVQRIDVTYTYSVATNSGVCRAGFFFSSPTKSDVAKDDSELTFEILKVKYDHQVNSEARKDIATKLERAIRDLIEFEYSKIISERTPVAVATE